MDGTSVDDVQDGCSEEDDWGTSVTIIDGSSVETNVLTMDGNDK